MQKLETCPQVQHVPSTRAHAMEHRFGPRYVCGTHVALSTECGVDGPGRMRNVSLSGAYVETALDLPLSAVVTLEKTGGAPPGIQRRAWVVRKDADGAGVEWCETPSRPICQMFGCGRPCRAGSGD